MRPKNSATRVLEPQWSTSNIVLYPFTGGWDEQRWMLETFRRETELDNYWGGPADENFVPQGFAVGTNYCYSIMTNSSAKIFPDTDYVLYRSNMDTGALSAMTISSGNKPALGHANDMALARHVDANGVTRDYIYVVAVGGNASPAGIVKLQYSGNTYQFVQRYNVGSYSGIARMGYEKDKNGVDYAVKFLLRNGGSQTDFSTVIIPFVGSADTPKLAFSINIPTSPTNYTKYGSQSIHYEPEIDRLYVLMWGYNADEGSYERHKNVLLVYNNVKNSTTQNPPPFVKAIEINRGSSNDFKFEIEGIGFPRGRTANPSDNDVLWFHTYEWNSKDNIGKNGGIYTDIRTIK